MRTALGPGRGRRYWTDDRLLDIIPDFPAGEIRMSDAYEVCDRNPILVKYNGGGLWNGLKRAGFIERTGAVIGPTGSRRKWRRTTYALELLKLRRFIESDGTKRRRRHG